MKETYHIILQTPIGPEKGTITFEYEDERLSGILKIFGVEKEFNGTIKGNQFEFTSELKSLITRITFTAKGFANGKTLEATAYSKYGTFKIIGNRA